jgi:hypothetical protein
MKWFYSLIKDVKTEYGCLSNGQNAYLLPQKTFYFAER